MLRALHALVVLSLLCIPLSAAARDVYLNGVRLDANTVVRNQKLDGCTVKFDEVGNIWVTAKGFDIAVGPAAVEPEPVVPADGKLTKRYFLFAPQKARDLVPYELDVYLNDALLKRVRPSDDQLIVEITKYVRPGKNAVRIVATKARSDKRAAGSPADVMTLVVGEGGMSGARVSIDKTLINYQINALDTRNITEAFDVRGR